MANSVAIVGRPNVGKSTFFNRLIGEKKAIMDNESGITRDRHYGYAEWTNKFFTVIDTGGYVTNSDDIFEEAIRQQVSLALDEASVILFMVDVNIGITELDKEFANYLRKTNKPVVIVANKSDTNEKSMMVGEFYQLGFNEIYPVSSQSGFGTGELLDKVVSYFQEEGDEDPDAGIPKITIAGRPNVGKSSFLNAILGKERSIVTEISGTTRDSIDTRYNQFGKEFIITDTAGIRRKTKVHEDVEFYSVLRSINAIEKSDVVMLMIDAQLGLESQDINILRIAQERNKGIVILVNKWDLVQKDTMTLKHYQEDLLSKIQPNTHIPVVFISALDKTRIFKAIETAIEVYEFLTTRISTSALNEAILPEIARYPPPSIKGKYIKIKYLTQLPTNYPSFALFCNLPQYIKEPYERFLTNKIRLHFEFKGAPIRLFFRKK